MSYFDDKEGGECGKCDICVSGKRNDTRIREAGQTVMQLLADNNSHSIEDLYALGYSKETIATTIRSLADEEKIVAENNKIRAKR